ncbi:MAG TPA: DUF3667 domain-containing protein [Flavobacteriales bacterium]|nr:DUF3667 domain-containing protein [Flavobacteriales bacterium]
MVTKPGLITKDFVEGKRARYVNPARFYVFVSVIFFLLFAAGVKKAAKDNPADTELGAALAEEGLSPRQSGLSEILPDSLVRAFGWDPEELKDLPIQIPIDAPLYRSAADRLRLATPEVLDSLLAEVDGDTLARLRQRLQRSLLALPVADSLNVPFRAPFRGNQRYFINRWHEATVRRGRLNDAELDSILTLRGERSGVSSGRISRNLMRLDAVDGRAEWVRSSLVRYAPYGMFLFMPFAAVLLRWFFARKRFYWEHLIFSIHIHTVNFMILGLITAVDLIREFPVVDALVFPLCLGYLLLALKRVYQRTWPSTIARLCLMVLPYFLGMLVLILVIPLFAGILFS